MERRIIECVPNYSEGCDSEKIRQIADAIGSVEGVKVLNIDPGMAANRTVITFAGEPEAVCEAAFRGAKTAADVIDMRLHHGTHPRIGATDVLPLVPISGVSLEECAEMARKLARRMADEAGIPCYCYEAAAFKPEHVNLADCRRGEYESIASRLATPGMEPDVLPDSQKAGAAPTEHTLQTGCSVVGARKYLIAVNFNLNTKDTSVAKDIALDVRERGRKAGQPGTLPRTKAIGWYIDEYGIAQVSMNICDIDVTPLHVAYEEVCRQARLRGYEVTGTEIIGLVPKRVLVEAGQFFMDSESSENSELYLMEKAVTAMHLDDLRPFVIEDKVIEMLLS